MSKRTPLQVESSTRRKKLPDTWQPGGRTHTEMNDGAVPRLPHEIDESADGHVAPPRDEMIQAQRDLSNGLRDTDRGQGVNNTYKRVRSESK